MVDFYGLCMLMELLFFLFFCICMLGGDYIMVRIGLFMVEEWGWFC